MAARACRVNRKSVRSTQNQIWLNLCHFVVPSGGFTFDGDCAVNVFCHWSKLKKLTTWKTYIKLAGMLTGVFKWSDWRCQAVKAFLTFWWSISTDHRTTWKRTCSVVLKRGPTGSHACTDWNTLLVAKDSKDFDHVLDARLEVVDVGRSAVAWYCDFHL